VARTRSTDSAGNLLTSDSAGVHGTDHEVALAISFATVLSGEEAINLVAQLSRFALGFVAD
jgi:hypothetical protein